MESPELDLTGFMPTNVRLKVGEDEFIDVPFDQPPGLISEANMWLYSHSQNSIDPVNNPIDVEEGWRIANELCGQDVRKIGVLGMIRLLHFFRVTTLDKLNEIYSARPLGSAVSSTEESLSETSLEAPDSSEQPSTS